MLMKDWKRWAHCSHQTVGGSKRGRQGTRQASGAEELLATAQSFLAKLKKVIGVLV